MKCQFYADWVKFEAKSQSGLGTQGFLLLLMGRCGLPHLTPLFCSPLHVSNQRKFNCENVPSALQPVVWLPAERRAEPPGFFEYKF